MAKLISDCLWLLLLADDNEGKPCFVHRDLSSRNVLVGPNVTCVLSDFGFAMKMPEIGSTKATDDIITEVGLNTCFNLLGLQCTKQKRIGKGRDGLVPNVCNGCVMLGICNITAYNQ